MVAKKATVHGFAYTSLLKGEVPQTIFQEIAALLFASKHQPPIAMLG